MISTAALVGLQIIGADHFRAVLSDEDFVSIGEPVGECLVSGHVARKSVDIAGPNDRLDDRPDRIAILRRGSPDGEHASSLHIAATAMRKLYDVAATNVNGFFGV